MPILDLSPLPGKVFGKLKLSPEQLLIAIHAQLLAEWALKATRPFLRPRLRCDPGGRPATYRDSSILLMAVVQTAWRKSYDQMVDYVRTHPGLSHQLGFTGATVSQGQYWERWAALGTLPFLFFFMGLVCHWAPYNVPVTFAHNIPTTFTHSAPGTFTHDVPDVFTHTIPGTFGQDVDTEAIALFQYMVTANDRERLWMILVNGVKILQKLIDGELAETINPKDRLCKNRIMPNTWCTIILTSFFSFPLCYMLRLLYDFTEINNLSGLLWFRSNTNMANT